MHKRCFVVLYVMSKDRQINKNGLKDIHHHHTTTPRQILPGIDVYPLSVATMASRLVQVYIAHRTQLINKSVSERECFGYKLSQIFHYCSICASHQKSEFIHTWTLVIIWSDVFFP